MMSPAAYPTKKPQIKVKNPQSHIGGRIFPTLSLCIISNGLPETIIDPMVKIEQTVPHTTEVPLNKLFLDELFDTIAPLALK